MATKELEKELKKINFNDLERVTPRRVIGRSKEWVKKLKINGAIWQLKWHYGVGARKDIRYGHASRYSNFPKQKALSATKLYKIDTATIKITISKMGIPKITKINIKESKYTGRTIPMLQKV